MRRSRGCAGSRAQSDPLYQQGPLDNVRLPRLTERPGCARQHGRSRAQPGAADGLKHAARARRAPSCFAAACTASLGSWLNPRMMPSDAKARSTSEAVMSLAAASRKRSATRSCAAVPRRSGSARRGPAAGLPCARSAPGPAARPGVLAPHGWTCHACVSPLGPLNAACTAPSTIKRPERGTLACTAATASALAGALQRGWRPYAHFATSAPRTLLYVAQTSCRSTVHSSMSL